jgi:hypothetical protein
MINNDTLWRASTEHIEDWFFFTLLSRLSYIDEIGHEHLCHFDDIKNKMYKYIWWNEINISA